MQPQKQFAIEFSKGRTERCLKNSGDEMRVLKVVICVPKVAQRCWKSFDER